MLSSECCRQGKVGSHCRKREIAPAGRRSGLGFKLSAALACRATMPSIAVEGLIDLQGHREAIRRESCRGRGGHWNRGSIKAALTQQAPRLGSHLATDAQPHLQSCTQGLAAGQSSKRVHPGAERRELTLQETELRPQSCRWTAQSHCVPARAAPAVCS